MSGSQSGAVAVLQMVPEDRVVTRMCSVQVGNVSEENRYWGYPEAYTKTRPSYYIPTTVGTSDLTASMSAAFASSSLALQNVDKAYAQVRLLIHVAGLMCGRENMILNLKAGQQNR